MKRWIFLLLVVLMMLSGCNTERPEQSQPTTETNASETGSVETPTQETAPSLLDRNASIVNKTNGAVVTFQVDAEICDLAFMGRNPLLICNNADENTKVIRLDPENYSVACTAELIDVVYPGDLAFRATETNFAYYSKKENAVIVFDAMLREIFRTKMPEDMVDPLICADMQTVYYAVDNELRAVNLETGISRPLRQRNCLRMVPRKSLFDDRVLVCDVVFEDGSITTEFISGENGETLGSDSDLIHIESYGQRYFLQRMEGIICEQLFGQQDAQVKTIAPREDTLDLYSVLSMNGLLGTSWKTGTGYRLRLYDLDSGESVSSVPLPGIEQLRSIVADPAGQYVWFFGTSGEKEALYRWDPSLTLKQDDTVYTSIRFTEENPDTEGLTLCRSRADALEQKYGIRLHLEQNIPASEDYAYTYEYHPEAFHLTLDQLERLLAQFPENFFRTLGRVSENGYVNIALVRELQGKTANAVPNGNGTQFWSGGNAWMVLKVTEDMTDSFYHVLAHVLDTYIMNEAVNLDDWGKLNPKGFDYDGSYAKYLTREDTTWLEGEKVAFVSTFAMTFPREDRAELFAAAMNPEAADLFKNEYLQNKLIQICKGIRDAFGWKKDQRTFPWEQYLEKSLVRK